MKLASSVLFKTMCKENCLILLFTENWARWLWKYVIYVFSLVNPLMHVPILFNWWPSFKFSLQTSNPGPRHWILLAVLLTHSLPPVIVITPKCTLFPNLCGPLINVGMMGSNGILDLQCYSEGVKYYSQGCRVLIPDFSKYSVNARQNDPWIACVSLMKHYFWYSLCYLASSICSFRQRYLKQALVTVLVAGTGVGVRAVD